MACQECQHAFVAWPHHRQYVTSARPRVPRLHARFKVNIVIKPVVDRIIFCSHAVIYYRSNLVHDAHPSIEQSKITARQMDTMYRA